MGDRDAVRAEGPSEAPALPAGVQPRPEAPGASHLQPPCQPPSPDALRPLQRDPSHRVPGHGRGRGQPQPRRRPGWEARAVLPGGGCFGVRGPVACSGEASPSPVFALARQRGASWSPEPPLASGTALSPVAWQPPGATRATAEPIPRGPAVSTASASGPGGRSHPPRAAAASCPTPGPAARPSMLEPGGAPWRAPPPRPQGGHDPRALWGQPGLKAPQLAVSPRQEVASVRPSSSPPVTRSSVGRSGPGPAIIRRGPR